MSDISNIRYQFLQLESAYTGPNTVGDNTNVYFLDEQYFTKGNIIFDKKRGTITVVHSDYDASNKASGYKEYGIGIASASFENQILTLVDNVGNSLTVNLSAFALDSELTQLSSRLNGLTTKINNTIEPQIGELNTAVTNLKGSANDTSSSESIVGAKKYADELVSNLGNVFEFKGVKNGYSELPSSDIEPGDVWQVLYGGYTPYGEYFDNNTEFFYGKLPLYAVSVDPSPITPNYCYVIKDISDIKDDEIILKALQSNGNVITSAEKELFLRIYNIDKTQRKAVSIIVDKDNNILYPTPLNVEWAPASPSYINAWQILGTNQVDYSSFVTIEKGNGLKKDNRFAIITDENTISEGIASLGGSQIQPEDDPNDDIFGTRVSTDRVMMKYIQSLLCWKTLN